MTDYRQAHGLRVAAEIHHLVEQEVLPSTGITPERFWQGFARIVAEFAPRTRELLARRDALQAAIDAWHRDRRGQAHDAGAYRAFLEQVGYLQPEGEAFGIDRSCSRRAPRSSERPSSSRRSPRRRRR